MWFAFMLTESDTKNETIYKNIFLMISCFSSQLIILSLLINWIGNKFGPCQS